MMQRSKQQALMFLLGALLVGGVLGLSADRVLARSDEHHSWAMRDRMYDDLGLSQAQRTTIDSILDLRNRQVDSVMAPVKPRLDSIRMNAKLQFRRSLTPEQWAKFLARVAQDSIRREQSHKSRDQQKKQ
jgi:hypothetical protein